MRSRNEDQVFDREWRGAAAVFFTERQGIRGLAILKIENNRAVRREWCE
jgi:hypothetical protein